MNILDHIIDYNGETSGVYFCKICNCRLWITKNQIENCFMLDDTGLFWQKLNLTCKEVTIKNIIE